MRVSVGGGMGRGGFFLFGSSAGALGISIPLLPSEATGKRGTFMWGGSPELFEDYDGVVDVNGVFSSIALFFSQIIYAARWAEAKNSYVIHRRPLVIVRPNKISD